MRWEEGRRGEKVNRWREMIIQIEYDLDRIIDIDHVEVTKRIGVGNGGAVDRIGLFLEGGRGEEKGQHYTPIFTIFFLCDIR